MGRFRWDPILSSLAVGEAYTIPIVDMELANKQRCKLRYTISEYCRKMGVPVDTFYVGVLFNSEVIQVVRDGV